MNIGEMGPCPPKLRIPSVYPGPFARNEKKPFQGVRSRNGRKRKGSRALGIVL